MKMLYAMISKPPGISHFQATIQSTAMTSQGSMPA